MKVAKPDDFFPPKNYSNECFLFQYSSLQYLQVHYYAFVFSDQDRSWGSQAAEI
jgi:hypothetical protein